MEYRVVCVESRVIDSRVVDQSRSIRRRRECEFCDHRFTTIERLVVTDLVVVKKDWSKQLYDRDKLKRALVIAFGKRDFSLEKIEWIIAHLESKWAGKWKEIASTQIGQDILETLKDKHEVAYVRFASVFMEFGGINDFAGFIWCRINK